MMVLWRIHPAFKRKILGIAKYQKNMNQQRREML